MNLKKIVRRLLEAYDRQGLIDLALEDRRVIPALNRLIFDEDLTLRWRAVEAMGWVAAEEPFLLEKIIARIIYTMNDDSGSIGWTAPYVLGEICACDPDLVEDFFPIVIDGIKNEVFRAGSAWAIGRVALVRPDLVEETGPALGHFLKDADPEVRGYCAWALGRLGRPGAIARLEIMTGDEETLPYYAGGDVHTVTVGQLAQKAIDRLKAK